MTTSGVLSRIIGFFYRIFLSRTIGAEALGIYQLISPVFSMCFALTASSIQTTISKFVGDSIGQCSDSQCKETRARWYLCIGLLGSSMVSVLVGAFVYHNANWIASHLLGEPRCAPLLILLTYGLLPGSIHACINGYYYGKKRAFLPSLCQVAEQFARVGSVYLFYQIAMEKHLAFGAYYAVVGLVIGEFAGLLVCSIAFAAEKRLPKGSYQGLYPATPKMCGMFYAMALPLTINRVTVALSSSLENLLIPQKLQVYGYSASDALSIYGILTGMTMSIILLPNVLTNSLSVLLLPAISEAKGQENYEKISLVIKKAVLYGLLLGLCFTLLFLLTGNWIGNVLFHNALAGILIRQLSWICPLMYLTSLLGSILHGLGCAGQVLFVNLLSCLIRISMICFLVPYYGIRAYLWAMLLSSVFTTLSCLILLFPFQKNP
jgi:stage V sporulation protein B